MTTRSRKAAAAKAREEAAANAEFAAVAAAAAATEHAVAALPVPSTTSLHAEVLASSPSVLEDGTFRALTEHGVQGQIELAEQYRESGDTPRLTTIPWPGGGALSFELSDEESLKVLDAIVLTTTRNRAWWETAPSEGGDSVPSCVSNDGLRGQAAEGMTDAYGVGGDCVRCPKNQWGTAEGRRKGKACKERKNLYLLLPDKIRPLVLSLPPSSLAPYSDFRGAAEDDGLIGTSMYVTRIGLERREGDGNKWSVAKFRRGPVLDTSAYSRAQDVARAWKPIIFGWQQALDAADYAVEEG